MLRYFLMLLLLQRQLYVTWSRIHSVNFEILVQTPGRFGSAHPMPQLMIPPKKQRPSLPLTTRGPPESPQKKINKGFVFVFCIFDSAFRYRYLYGFRLYVCFFLSSLVFLCFFIFFFLSSLGITFLFSQSEFFNFLSTSIFVSILIDSVVS